MLFKVRLDWMIHANINSYNLTIALAYKKVLIVVTNRFMCMLHAIFDYYLHQRWVIVLNES
ncbi:hypothetical protein MC195_09350 (plasmid) [Moraxella catarrhalis]|nr:hypothetical protein MC195_09350 [Moraxella catarrhalis]